MSSADTFSLDEMQQALGAVEEGSDEISSLQKQVDSNNEQLNDILFRVNDLVGQVNLINQRSLSILRGEVDGDLLKTAGNVSNLLLETVPLNLKAANLLTTNTSIEQQIQKLRSIQSRRNPAMDNDRN